MGQRLGALEHHPHFTAALAIVSLLRKNGFQALFAGGCVRDAWLGITAHDIDIATSARPDDIAAIFPKTLDVGKAFGTMVVVLSDAQFEVTTFRRDGDYLDGRHPETVTFSDAEEDAKRRDFTINALFYDPIAFETIDYVNGLQDLEAHVIRTVGVAGERFNEDQLRLLRAVRFSSQLGFDIELKTWKAIEELAEKIKNVSRERVWQELIKLLRGKKAKSALERLVRSRLAGGGVWPTLQQFNEDKDKWKSFMDRATWLHHPETYFAMFAVLTSDVAAFFRDLESLRPSRQLMQSVKSLAQTHVEFWNHPSKLADRIRALGSSEGSLVLEMSEAEAHVTNGGLEKLERWIAEFLQVCDGKAQLPKPLLTGEILLQMGFSAGPIIGKVLEEVYSLQLEGQINSLEQARRLAKKLGGTNNVV